MARIFSRRTLAVLAFGMAVLATGLAGYYSIEKMRGRASPQRQSRYCTLVHNTPQP